MTQDYQSPQMVSEAEVALQRRGWGWALSSHRDPSLDVVATGEGL